MSQPGKEVRYHEFSHHRELAQRLLKNEQPTSHTLIHSNQEMLDMILGHAVETFELHPHLSVQGARICRTSYVSGHFIVRQLRQPTPDEFDFGALLVLRVRVAGDTVLNVLEIFIHEQTQIAVQY